MTKYRRGEGRVPGEYLTRCKKGCFKADGCQFEKTGECASSKTMQNHTNRLRNEAARKIQKQARVTLLRKRVKSLSNIKRKQNAAQKIQKQARVTLMRKRVKSLAKSKREQNASKRIQRQARVTLLRKRVQQKIDDRRLKELMNASIKRDAAIKIQRAFRKRSEGRDKLPNDWPSNLARPDVKDYLKMYSLKLKKTMPIKTTKLIGTGNRCKNKGNPENLFSVPQAMMHALARGIQKGTNRGLLAWHSTGSGKTCTGAAIMDAFWNTDKNIVFVTSIEAKSSNPPENFQACINKYLKRKVTANEMSRRVKFFSFASLAHYLQLYRPSGPASESQKRSNLLNNAVLIIDEVQNLLKPLPQQVNEHKKLYAFLKSNTTKTQALNTFILTATPGESAKDVVDLLNLVRDRKHTEIKVPKLDDRQSLKDFDTKIKGIVQYYNTNNDLSRFPKVVYNDVYKCNMSDAQYKEYQRAYNEDSQKTTEYPKPKYFAMSRKYAGMMYNREDNMKLHDFSCKLPKLLSIVQKHNNEKHWIYSAFYERRGYGQGVMGIKNVLENEPGLKYEMLTPSMARSMIAGRTKMTKKKRFCMVTTTTMNKPLEDLKDLLEVYNHEDNKHGEICQIMLASQKYNEGVDLKAVRHIHLFEPTLTEAMRQQAIGRARRNCSHAQFDRVSDWNVQIHEYDGVRENKVVKSPTFRRRFPITTRCRAPFKRTSTISKAYAGRPTSATNSSSNSRISNKKLRTSRNKTKIL